MANQQSVIAVIRAARPTFRNAHDKAAFAVHAAFLASGFVLHATGPSASVDDALSSSSTGEIGEGNYTVRNLTFTNKEALNGHRCDLYVAHVYG
ncbi:putative proteasome inhibitor [Capsicum chinense]|nr:putative proteasome inhibitor [Capsicum chinense]